MYNCCLFETPLHVKHYSSYSVQYTCKLFTDFASNVSDVYSMCVLCGERIVRSIPLRFASLIAVITELCVVCVVNSFTSVLERRYVYMYMYV